MFNQQPAITKRVVDLLGWPTDVVSIDHLTQQSDVHTYILFVPGNPGLVGWYIPPLEQILQQLGPGFAGRGISYAGHGVTKDIVTVEDYEYPNESSSSSSSTRRNVQIPWTVNGQVEHKIAWLESMKEELKGKKLIFLSHSIGAHLIQRLLVLCQDSWRLRTSAIIHWMPFIRMDAPWQEKIKLDTAARYPDFVIHCSRQLLSNVSRSMKESALADKVLDKEGLDLAVNLVSHPTFVRNFFELGTEEIRDLPQLPDVSIIGFTIVMKYGRFLELAWVNLQEQYRQ